MLEQLTVRRGTVLFWLILVPSAFGALLLAPQADARTILAWPLVAAIVLLAGTLIHWSRPHLPLSKSGCWAVLTTSVYTIMPLAAAVAVSGEYTPLNDARLFTLQPSPSFIARVGWYHVVYLASLCFGYSIARSADRDQIGHSPPVIRRDLSAALLACFAVIAVLFAVIRPDAPNSGYAGAYLAIQQLPLPIRQALRLMSGIRLILGLGVLVWAFGSWQTRRYGVMAVLLLLFALTLTRAGERSTVAFATVACIALRHRYVKPIRVGQFFALGLVGLLGFTALGIYRTYRGLEDRSAFAVVPGSGEFEIVFANAVDLADRREQGSLVPAPIGVQLADFVSAIPSQLLPFAKQDMADWFLSTYYPTVREEGGGLAFGVVAQSIIGFGVIELLIRGLVLGILLARFDRWAERRANQFWPMVVHLWVLLATYQTTRISTFYPLGAFIQQVPVSFVLVSLVAGCLAALRYARRHGTDRALAASSP